MSEPLIPGMIRCPQILHRYVMPETVRDEILSMDYNFGYETFSEVVYARTYSQLKADGSKETFPETIIRVINSVISIEKNHRINNGLNWDKNYWDDIALRFGRSMMKMNFLPPGRGLWIAGTEYSYTRGSAAFNNCGFISLREGILTASSWMMDMLMCGCGIGFDMRYIQEEFDSFRIPETFERVHVVHDSREGWVESLYLLIKSYMDGEGVIFDYSSIRPKGVKLSGFGGESSGYEPLKQLHSRIRIFFECYIKSKTEDNFTCIKEMTKKHAEIFTSNPEIRNSILYSLAALESMPDEISSKKTYGPYRLIADIFNAIALCVIAGNIRRSSQIALGPPDNLEFIELKNENINPERLIIGWVSNNSVILEKTEDFNYLPEISRRVQVNGEPGFINLMNAQRYGRYGRREPIGREGERDECIGGNPCGEILLKSGELCNLSNVFLSRCKTIEEIEEATYLATLYSSIVSLLPTHWIFTNQVIAENRRVGISHSGIIEYIEKTSASHYTTLCRRLYKLVRKTNSDHAKECGVKESIRVTTVKPSGTISNLAGDSPGIHHSLFEYCIRRIRISSDTKIAEFLTDSRIPWEYDVKEGNNTKVFSFAIKMGSKRPANTVGIWEQAANLAMAQREWADNAVSCTIHVRPDEFYSIEHVLSSYAPIIKGMSLLPLHEREPFPQMPYESITKTEYENLKNITEIDFNYSRISDKAIGVKFCDSSQCSL